MKLGLIADVFVNNDLNLKYETRYVKLNQRKIIPFVIGNKLSGQNCYTLLNELLKLSDEEYIREYDKIHLRNKFNQRILMKFWLIKLLFTLNFRDKLLLIKNIYNEFLIKLKK